MMEKLENTENRSPRVFISYSKADKEIARRIANDLHNQGVNVWFDQYAFQVGDSIVQAIQRAIYASDYLIVLLSPNSVGSRWVKRELNIALANELATRDVTLLPVLIEDCQIPPMLASRRYLDFRSNFEEGLTKLVEQIGLVPNIDFSLLDAKSFEMLIADLLRELGFTEIEREHRLANRQIDIKALYSRTDPFGLEITETWLVEVKFYREARADLKSIQQITTYISRLPESFRGLLVTNGQITSAARQWLGTIQDENHIEIRVLDSTDLKRILLQHKDLVYKYFRRNADVHNE